jgi:hypothetical protein
MAEPATDHFPLLIATRDPEVCIAVVRLLSSLFVTILIRLSSSRSPINSSHQFASYHDSHTKQKRLFTDD